MAKARPPSPEAKRLYREADRLYAEQRQARGTVKAMTLGEKPKPCKIPGPYEATPENEARARRIIQLRKAAARA